MASLAIVSAWDLLLVETRRGFAVDFSHDDLIEYVADDAPTLRLIREVVASFFKGAG